MFLQAQREFPEITAASSVMFGDSLADIEFGRRLGMLTVLIDGDAGRQAPGAEDARKLADSAVRVACRSGGCAVAISRSVSAQIKNRFEDSVGLRKDRVFQHRLIGHERVHCAYALDGRVEVVEEFVGNASGDLCTVAPTEHVFVSYDHAAGLADWK